MGISIPIRIKRGEREREGMEEERKKEIESKCC